MRLLKFLAIAALSLCSTAIYAADDLDYRSADNFTVMGTLAPDASAKYSRLPDSLQNNIREELWNLGLNSAGVMVRFRSDSPRLGVKWHSRNKFGMNHMTDTGVRGLDLYTIQPDSSWMWINSARPSRSSSNSRSTLATDMQPGVMREYALFLSLYDGVDSLYIGVDSAAVLEQHHVQLPVREKPVLMYGTSILQGGCATRPGMAHTNILERMLNREVINLGFSGNARLDPEIAALMAQADASLFVIDALPNCKAEMLEEKLEPFVAIIRQKHPDTPILLVESPLFPAMRYNMEVKETITEKNATLKRIYDRMSLNDANLHYFDGAGVLGDQPENTVDNYHFTDEGFNGFAKSLYPVILTLIRP